MEELTAKHAKLNTEFKNMEKKLTSNNARLNTEFKNVEKETTKSITDAEARISELTKIEELTANNTRVETDIADLVKEVALIPHVIKVIGDASNATSSSAAGPVGH